MIMDVNERGLDSPDDVDSIYRRRLGCKRQDMQLLADIVRDPIYNCSVTASKVLEPFRSNIPPDSSTNLFIS